MSRVFIAYTVALKKPSSREATANASSNHMVTTILHRRRKILNAHQISLKTAKSMPHRGVPPGKGLSLDRLSNLIVTIR
jgi:hypothetical protein